MELNKLVFGGLAVGCMAAAAGGGYLAARPAPAPTSATAATPISGPSTTSPAAVVDESEGVIAPEATAPAPRPPAAAAPPAEAPRPPAAAVPAAEAPRREAAPRPTRVAPAESRARAESPAAGQAPTARSAPAAAKEPTVAPAAPARGGMWDTRPSVTPDSTSTPDWETSSTPARRAAGDVEPAAPARIAPETVELTIPADAVLGLQIERTITSETARVEDRVEARVTRDVRVGDKVAIPAGSIVQGSVLEVDRGGKVRERARLGVRFHTVVLANGSRLNIRTDAVTREGQSPAKESAAKIGGAAVGGAILGAILGGGKGAVIGGATGAAGGTAATMASERNAAVLTAGTTVSVRVQQPVIVTVEHEQ